MRLITSVIFAFLALIALWGCRRNHAIGTWQEDVRGGGQLLITFRKDNTFTLLYSTAGQDMLVARIDGTYEMAGMDRLQMHPTATNLVGGSDRSAAYGYGQLQDFQNFAATGIFELFGPDIGQMPWGKQTTKMRRIENADLAPTMSAEEITFSTKAKADHEIVAAAAERFKREQAQRAADDAARQQQAFERVQAAEQQATQQQTQPQPDPTSTAQTDTAAVSPAAMPDPIAPGAVSSGDSTPPVNGDAGNVSTNGDSSGTSDQSSTSTTG